MANGFSTESYLDLFYDNIWVIPNTIELTGQSIGYSTIITVWNSYNAVKHLTSIPESNTTGLSFVGNNPETFNPFATSEYTLTLTSSAPPQINATYQFIFSDAEDPYLLVSGSTAEVFSFPPDWSNGIDEKLSFSTRIIPSHNGEEQNIKLRSFPRISYNYSLLLADNSNLRDAAILNSYFHNQLLQNMGRSWVLPIWADLYSLTQNMTVGSNNVTIDTTTRDFYVGQIVLLYNKWNDYQLLTISSIASNSLTFTSTASKTWKMGQSYVLPTRTAALTEDTISGNMQTSWLADKQINWDLFVQNTNQSSKYQTYTPTYTYRGYDVYIKNNNFDQDVAMTINSYQRLLDYGTGIFKIDPTYKLSFLRYGILDPTRSKGYTKEGYSFNYILKTRAEYKEFLSFVKYRAGRWLPCWIPTFGNEIQIAQGGTSSSTTITIRDIGYSTYVKLNKAKRMILLYDGITYRFYRIINYQNNGNGTETLTLDMPIGINFTTTTFRDSCFMKFMRLANDEVTIHWETDGFATTSLSFIETTDIT
jgi:hypothetical protein